MNKFDSKIYLNKSESLKNTTETKLQVYILYDTNFMTFCKR